MHDTIELPVASGGTSTPTPPLAVFVAFAGGGAKGLVHIGALKALESKNVVVSGLSGTSAGAIVAALRACGFKADDMADPAAQRTILDELAAIDASLSKATDLFGPGGWTQVAGLRRVMACGLSRIVVAAGISTTFLLLGSFIVAASSHVGMALTIWGLWMGALIAAVRWIRSILGGLSKLERFKTALGRLLADRVSRDSPDAR